MEKQEFIKAVIAIYDLEAMREYKIVSMAELADGVIVVLDSQNERDTYFDKTKWEYARPQAWWGTKSYDGVGVMPGGPTAKSFEAAMDLVPHGLRSKIGSALNKLPQPIEYPVGT